MDVFFVVCFFKIIFSLRKHCASFYWQLNNILQTDPSFKIVWLMVLIRLPIGVG